MRTGPTPKTAHIPQVFNLEDAKRAREEQLKKVVVQQVLEDVLKVVLERRHDALDALAAPPPRLFKEVGAQRPDIAKHEFDQEVHALGRRLVEVYAGEGGSGEGGGGGGGEETGGVRTAGVRAARRKKEKTNGSNTV